MNDDEAVQFCSKMENEFFYEEKRSIQELYDKFSKEEIYSVQNAEYLMRFRCMRQKDWAILKLFHKIILAYPEENIEGLPFNQTLSLLLFMNWLWNVPSLRV